MTDLQSFTLMMASAQVVETSVNTNNSPSQDYYTTNPDDHSNTIYIYILWYSEIICATACQCEMCSLLAERLTYPSFETILSCTDETSKVETGLSVD